MQSFPGLRQQTTRIRSWSATIAPLLAPARLYLHCVVSAISRLHREKTTILPARVARMREDSNEISTAGRFIYSYTSFAEGAVCMTRPVGTVAILPWATTPAYADQCVDCDDCPFPCAGAPLPSLRRFRRITTPQRKKDRICIWETSRREKRSVPLAAGCPNERRFDRNFNHEPID